MEFFGPRGEKSIIYLEAFVEAINNSGNDSDHSNSIVLRAMFERADSDKQGYISKEQLLQLIQEDIQNGQKENKSFDSIYNTIDSENFGLSSFK
jgi:Ca2+-binding EF-hand superfamily protein